MTDIEVADAVTEADEISRVITFALDPLPSTAKHGSLCGTGKGTFYKVFDVHIPFIENGTLYVDSVYAYVIWPEIRITPYGNLGDTNVINMAAPGSSQELKNEILSVVRAKRQKVNENFQRP